MKLSLLTLFSAALCLQAADWKPLDPADLTLQHPRVDPKADAEVLLWDITVADQAANREYASTEYRYFVRLKIFTDRGAKNFQSPEIFFTRKQQVGDIAGRTIQPDGSIQEVAKSDIRQRVLEKRKGVNDRAASLAMPNVKPGTVIEYRWREIHDGELANNVALPAGREIPVEHLVYHIKPLTGPDFPYSMHYRPFGIPIEPFKQEMQGFFTTSAQNIPAFSEEEDAPPTADTRPWMLIYYQPDSHQSVDDYWKSQGKNHYGWYKQRTKVNGDVKRVAEEAIGNATAPDEQIERLFVWCRKNIKDLSGPDVSDAERFKRKELTTSVDTIRSGAGYPTDIQIAFTALVEAAGFTARPTMLPDREIKFFDKSLANPYFLPARDTAVNVNGTWKFYDVTLRYLQPGHLRWQEEGVPALILDDKNPVWTETPITEAAKSCLRRGAVFTLNESGSLEGNIVETLEGHPAEEWREINLDLSPGEREEAYRKSIQRRFSSAEVSNLVLSDPADLSKPVQLRATIKVDGYATRTGKRLIFSPAFFEMNTPARFTATERKNPVYIRYGWSESDNVTVRIPQGFALDHGDAPAPIALRPFLDYSVKISYAPALITYHRELMSADKGTNIQPRERYAAVKQIYDAVHASDAHMLTLKAQTSTVAQGN